MRRIGILTAGGDTPALNATIYGAVVRANALRIEVYGIIKGFSGMLNPRVPHVHLNPLFSAIPELCPSLGGTLLGMTFPVPEALIQMSLFLAALTFMYLGVRAVGDGEYRSIFLDPLVDDLHCTLIARNRYRGGIATAPLPAGTRSRRGSAIDAIEVDS